MSTLVKFRHRQATSAEFEFLNPVLLQGEPSYETDTRRTKVGDGVTAYNDLPFELNIDYGTTLPSPSDYNEGDIFLLIS